MKYVTMKYLLLGIISSFVLISCSGDKTTTPSDNNNNNNNNNTTTPPKITQITPNPASVGYQVTITGDNFGTTKDTIDFNGKKPKLTDVVSWGNTEIKVFVPEATSTGNVTVYVKGVASNAVSLTIQQPSGNPPFITSLSQTIAQPQQKIAIFGSNFGNQRGTSYVEFNGLKADTYPAWSDKQIDVIVPSGVTSGKLIVYVNNIASNAKDFKAATVNEIVSMVLVTSGNMVMGDDASNDLDDKPAHNVTISYDFYMAKTETSQKQWKTVMNQDNPSTIDIGDDFPVQQVTFTRVMLFCNRLSAMEGKTPCYDLTDSENVVVNWSANGYRLPTEAEWEYACRAGKSGDYSASEIGDIAWTNANSNGRLHPVGSLKSNPFGIFDMFGNAAEMCWDWYDADYYAKSPTTDPRGPSAAVTTERVKRGMSFLDEVSWCRISKRDSYQSTAGNFLYYLGFRVVRNK